MRPNKLCGLSNSTRYTKTALVATVLLHQSIKDASVGRSCASCIALCRNVDGTGTRELVFTHTGKINVRPHGSLA